MTYLIWTAGLSCPSASHWAPCAPSVPRQLRLPSLGCLQTLCWGIFFAATSPAVCFQQHQQCHQECSSTRVELLTEPRLYTQSNWFQMGVDTDYLLLQICLPYKLLARSISTSHSWLCRDYRYPWQRISTIAFSRSNNRWLSVSRTKDYLRSWNDFRKLLTSLDTYFIHSVRPTSTHFGLVPSGPRMRTMTIGSDLDITSIRFKLLQKWISSW